MTRRVKKALALMLAVIMICPQYAFPVSAEESASVEESLISEDTQVTEDAEETTSASEEKSDLTEETSQTEDSEEIETPSEEDGVISQDSFDENSCYTISEGGEYTLEAGISGWIKVETTDAVTIIGTGCDVADNTTAYTGLSITGTVEGIDLTIKDLYITSGNSASGYNDGTYYNILNFQGAGNKLTLAGTNDLEAMANGAVIHVPSTAELTIDEAEEGGVLYLYKSGAWTGIGGNGYELNGKLTFNGGTIFAKGTKMGALIGSGAEIESGVPGDIVINGGTMNLLANARGAAIGTGAGSTSDNSGNVYLNGGSVNINVDFSGSAIGLGNKDTGAAGNLYVKGGSLRVYVDQNAISSWGIDEAGVNPIAVTANMTNGEAEVYMVTVPTAETEEGIYTVKVDGAVYYAGGLHTYKYVNESFVQGEQADISNTTTNWVAGDDTNLYLYLTGEDHTLDVNGVKYNAVWNSETESFAVEEKVLDPSISWYNTKDTEFVLTTAEQLKGFASIVNGTSEDFEQDNFAGKTVKLGADIAVAEDGLYKVIEDVTYGNSSWPLTTDQYVLQEEAPIWTPIGSGTATGNSNATTANAFAGTFDGDGHTISGIYTGTKNAAAGNTDTVQGLFGVVTGTVKNVTVSGCITGKIVVGGIAAVLKGGVIENCTNNAVVFTDGGTTPGAGKEDGLYKGGAVGGIAGFAAGTGSIVDCVNKAVVTCANSAQGGRVGGILGLIDSRTDAISVSRCANTGAVNGYQYVGGIMGMNYAKTSPIDSCYNAGKITAAGSQKVHTGGIVGQFNCQVTNCYNTGEIHLSKPFGDQFNYVGGIAGDYDYSARNGKVINCYSIGEVTCVSSPSSATHSLDSVLGDGPLSNCYYLNEIVASYMKKSSAVSKTADEMKSVAFVASLGSAFSYDSENINDGYPVLSWQGGTEVYAVTLTEGEGYSIAAAEGYETGMLPGSEFKFTVTAEENYVIGSVKAGETELTAEDGVYTIAEVNSNITVTVEMIKRAPHTITTAEDLALLAAEVNAGENKAGETYTLGADIDLAAVCGEELGSWASIGGAAKNVTLTITSQEELNAALETYKLIYDNAGISYKYGTDRNTAYSADRSYYYVSGQIFSGTFDGAGHTISNLYVNTSAGYAGLFGNVNGTVKDVTVSGTVTSTAKEKDFVGGITGLLSEGGTISDVVSNITVSAGNVYNVGGIAGFVGTKDAATSAENTTVVRCINNGAVTGYSQVGGIAGQNAGIISLCVNNGKIQGLKTGSKAGVGGIVGRNGNNYEAIEKATISNCYNTGEVGISGQKWVGGITGFQNALSKVENCYNVGNIIQGAGQCNPIVGQNEGTAVNCWYQTGLYASEPSGTGVYGGNITDCGNISEAQMKSAALVARLGDAYNKDIEDAQINNGYPVLKWQGGRELIALELVSSPENVTTFTGKTAEFAVKATGEELTYQWYYSNDNGIRWYKSGMTGSTTDTLTVVATAARSGQKYRCVVTDAMGNQVTSEAAVLTAKEIQVAITAQPEDFAGQPGDYASFTVAAAGEGLTYQWQYSNNGSKWYNSGMTGADTDTLTVQITSGRNGQQYRCVVTDADGNQVVSDAATLTVGIKVAEQPESYEGTVGTTATFTVKASGLDLTYQWQYSNNGTKWYNSGMAGAKTDTLSVAVTNARNGQQYRCVITDANGVTVITDAAAINVVTE